MKFSTNTLNEIKDRIPVSQVVGKKVQLKKKGREYVGLSPFNKEKTPSFTVNDEKQFYHCFSTNKHGDIFTFLVEVGGLSFPEAVEKLAEEAGVQLKDLSPLEEEKFKKNKDILKALDISKSFFSSQIYETNNSHAIKYLRERGIDDKIIKNFDIGFAPLGSQLEKFLLSKGVSHEVMILAGMVIKNDNNENNFYDRFRNRVIFPIRDSRSRVVGFGGRVINKDDQPKYLNSPETPVFHKGSILYNFSQVRPGLKEKDDLIVVEGYMDVVSLSSKGFNVSVAPLGTAITENQLNILWKENNSPIICFDGDRAGKAASYRVSELALKLLKPNKSLRFISLPNDLDPDDYIKSYGLKNFLKLVSDASPLTSIIWDSCMNISDINTPEGRSGFESELRKKINLINDSSIKKHYGLIFKQYLDDLFYKKTINTSYNKNIFVKKGFASSNLKTSKLASGGELPSDLEALIVSGVFLFPELITNFFEKFELADFKNSKLKEIRDNLLMFEKKDDGDLGIDLLKDYIKNNYKGFSEENLKFANKFWLNQKNKDFREISKVWLEILSDDQHIKSLERDIQGNKSKISNEDDERRFIELIKDKDSSIKSIEEKYGKEES
jgi:DNA primase